jgi:hypothetical protein
MGVRRFASVGACDAATRLARDGGLTADQSLPANIQSLWERLLAMAAAQATDASFKQQ